MLGYPYKFPIIQDIESMLVSMFFIDLDWIFALNTEFKVNICFHSVHVLSKHPYSNILR